MSEPHQSPYDRAELISALALGLRPVAEILQLHGVTGEIARALASDPTFRAEVAQKRREWMSEGRATERITAKATMALERAIEDLCSISGDRSVPGVARVAAAKQLQEIAGFRKSDDPGDRGPMLPNITINIGPRAVEVAQATRDVTPVLELDAGDS